MKGLLSSHILGALLVLPDCRALLTVSPLVRPVGSPLSRTAISSLNPQGADEFGPRSISETSHRSGRRANRHPHEPTSGWSSIPDNPIQRVEATPRASSKTPFFPIEGYSTTSSSSSPNFREDQDYSERPRRGDEREGFYPPEDSRDWFDPPRGNPEMPRRPRDSFRNEDRNNNSRPPSQFYNGPLTDETHHPVGKRPFFPIEDDNMRSRSYDREPRRFSDNMPPRGDNRYAIEDTHRVSPRHDQDNRRYEMYDRPLSGKVPFFPIEDTSRAAMFENDRERRRGPPSNDYPRGPYPEERRDPYPGNQDINSRLLPPARPDDFTPKVPSEVQFKGSKRTSRRRDTRNDVVPRPFPDRHFQRSSETSRRDSRRSNPPRYREDGRPRFDRDEYPPRYNEDEERRRDDRYAERDSRGDRYSRSAPGNYSSRDSSRRDNFSPRSETSRGSAQRDRDTRGGRNSREDFSSRPHRDPRNSGKTGRLR